MDLLIITLLLGLVEGLTEFIPVSSTGHLILFGAWLDFEGPHAASFEIFIQLGAILAVVVLYKARFIRLLQKISLGQKGDTSEKPELSVIHLSLTIIPVVIFGFLLYSTIKNDLFNSTVVAIGLIVGGVVMIIVDSVIKKGWRIGTEERVTSLDGISYRQALGVGIAQCFSLWPGVSRSAATIIGGVVSGLDYTVAAEYSFIVAVPVMIMAVGYDLLKSMGELTVSDAGYFLLGGFISFIIAVFSIKIFMGLVKRFKLTPFGWYRIVLGSLVLLLLK